VELLVYAKGAERSYRAVICCASVTTLVPVFTLILAHCELKSVRH